MSDKRISRRNLFRQGAQSAAGAGFRAINLDEAQRLAHVPGEIESLLPKVRGLK